MKYNFKDILNAEIYDNTKVMFIFGKYITFNNMVSDTLKDMCINSDTPVDALGVDDEFGIKSSENDDSGLANVVDFATFIDVIGVANINGKWFCKADLASLTKKQKDFLNKYIKTPSDNGILVITSDDWKVYKEYLKNRVINNSKETHMFQLNFPNKPVLKSIVHQLFEDKGIEIDSAATDFFIMRMSNAYDDYEAQIDRVVDMHTFSTLSVKDLKEYMKGIENFIVDDYVVELTKPLSSEKTNNKKVLRMMIALEDELTAKGLVYQVLKQVDEYIDFRVMINSGIIPIGINYFFNDVIKELGDNNKYAKMNEWLFRKKAYTASLTSLRDWEYIKIILQKAIENPKLPNEIIEMRCERALYDISTRSVISSSRINNIIGIENILTNKFDSVNKISYDEQSLNKLTDEKILVNKE